MMSTCSSVSLRLDVADLLVHVTLHPAAQGRVELREIAKLQNIGARPGIRSGGMLAQIALGLDRRRAAGAGSGDRLSINAIGHVAGDENSRVLALGQMPNEQITVRIRLEFAGKRLRVRVVPDRDEDAGDRRIFSSFVTTLRSSPRSSRLFRR